MDDIPDLIPIEKKLDKVNIENTEQVKVPLTVITGFLGLVLQYITLK